MRSKWKHKIINKTIFNYIFKQKKFPSTMFMPRNIEVLKFCWKQSCTYKIHNGKVFILKKFKKFNPNFHKFGEFVFTKISHFYDKIK